MTIKTGIDIVYIPRFITKLNRPEFVSSIFTEHELKDSRPEHLAGLFAAKEAFFKATQVKIKRWNQLEVTHLRSGKPAVEVLADIDLSHLLSVDCSISHDQDYAIAQVTTIS